MFYSRRRSVVSIVDSGRHCTRDGGDGDDDGGDDDGGGVVVIVAIVASSGWPSSISYLLSRLVKFNIRVSSIHLSARTHHSPTTAFPSFRNLFSSSPTPPIPSPPPPPPTSSPPPPLLVPSVMFLCPDHGS